MNCTITLKLEGKKRKKTHIAKPLPITIITVLVLLKNMHQTINMAAV
jgi:hypothetical protein